MIMRGDKIIPPTGIRTRLLNICHEGHLGISKTKGRIRNAYWWPGLDKDVEKLIRDCVECNNADKSHTILRPQLHPLPCPDMPWDRIGIDITGPVQDQDSTKYIIVLIDYFSKWPEIEIVERADTGAVLTFLDRVIQREGVPKCIISDNGPQFTSNSFKKYTERNGIVVVACNDEVHTRIRI